VSKTEGKMSGKTNNDSESTVRYFKLPYTGNHSKLTVIKIKKLCKHLCNDLNIKLVFFVF